MQPTSLYLLKIQADERELHSKLQKIGSWLEISNGFPPLTADYICASGAKEWPIQVKEDRAKSCRIDPLRARAFERSYMDSVGGGDLLPLGGLR